MLSITLSKRKGGTKSKISIAHQFLRREFERVFKYVVANEQTRPRFRDGMPACTTFKSQESVHTCACSQVSRNRASQSIIESSEGFLISPQILSRDSVTVDVDAVCYYKVFNPIVAIANVENFR